jgi:hypothetical protein
MRWANSDPITGQAAWFDLRVSIEKADPKPAESQPAFTADQIARWGPVRTLVARKI